MTTCSACCANWKPTNAASPPQITAWSPEIGSRGLAREHACKDTATLLSQLLRVTPGEASARVRAAAGMGPRRGLSGEVLAPIFARVAAAQAAGTISVAHASIITATIDELPAAVQTEHDQSVETFLVEQAQNFDPNALASVAHRLRTTLDPDGILADEAHRRRDLTIRHRPDGSSHLDAELTAICTEALLTVLDTLARPARPRTARKTRAPPGNATTTPSKTPC
jgi:Domain of unknown function (DUF222)